MTPVRIGCLDTPAQPTIGTVGVLGDELHEREEGRSSSAAKKAEAAFRISLARRNSAFSRRNLAFALRIDVRQGAVGRPQIDANYVTR